MSCSEFNQGRYSSIGVLVITCGIRFRISTILRPPFRAVFLPDSTYEIHAEL